MKTTRQARAAFKINLANRLRAACKDECTACKIGSVATEDEYYVAAWIKAVTQIQKFLWAFTTWSIRTGFKFDYALFKGGTPRGHTEFGSREELRHGRRKRHGGAHSRTSLSYLDSRRATRRPG